MRDIVFLEDITVSTYTNKYGSFSNTIYTFDCEAVSLFDIEGKLKPFDYSLPTDYYRGRLKVSVPYIYQIGIENDIYYSNDFLTLTKVLKKISDKRLHKFFYVHNLSYDAQFIFNIIERNNWTISNMLSVGKRKIVSFDINELNISFRCSYKLTNLSLEKSAIRYNCKHQKLKGYLDYNKAHSPETVKQMTKKELSYCEYDCIVLYEVLCYFRNKYTNIKQIPLTQTGEVRRELRNILPFSYFKEVAKKYPSPLILYYLTKCFQGGITHANFLNVDRTINCLMYDIASSYPYELITKKYPTGQFFKVDKKYFESHKESHCFIIHCIFHNLSCKKCNHYISDSKLINEHNAILDNGRVIKCDGKAEMFLTEIDFDIITQDYNYTKIEFIDIYASRKHYLHITIVKFILDMYKAKTQLKHSDYDFYMKAKQCINAMFGICSESPIKSNVKFNLLNFDNSDDFKLWTSPKETPELYENIVADIKKHKSKIMPFSVGVWCTAYSRSHLWKFIEYNKQTDLNTIYYDTDSNKIKYFDGLRDAVKDLNEIRNKEVKQVCLDRGLNYSDFEPVDTENIKHPIGIFDFEGKGKLKTLGAKKYCVKKEGKFEITVAGVKKKTGSKLTKGFKDFNVGKKYGYNMGKLTLFYSDGNQKPFEYTDYLGNIIKIDWCKFAVITQPTEYILGITGEFDNLLNHIDNYIKDL